MSNWDLVQQMKVGASPQTCQMGGAKFRFDARSYGSALQEEGYPLIRQWADRNWNAETRAECLQFLQDSINRGSIPMLSIASLALRGDATAQIVQALSASELARLDSLLKIGAAMEEWQEHLSGWSIESACPEF